MARFVFAMNISLDGYVDHEHFAPDPELFRHWIDQVGNAATSIYGRRTYEIMRYWEEDQPEWSRDDLAFAQAWRAQHKYVVSRTLAAVGPNATLISRDIDARLRELKDSLPGQVDISGTLLADSLARLGLMDEYRLYYHPVVLGRGKPMFPGPLPRLHLRNSARIGPSVLRLDYATG